MNAHESGEGLVGRSLLRREDEHLLRGRGRFLDDLPEPRNTLHLAFVMSPHAHARIVGIDADAALALPGVVAVLTGEDFAPLIKPITTLINHPSYRPTGRDPLARDKVRFVGEQVAVVLAETPYIAQDAIELIAVEYDVLPGVSDAREATLDGAPRIHDNAPDNILMADEFKTADFDAVFAAADVVVEDEFKIGRIAGLSLEPRGCLALCDHMPGAVTLYTSTQVPHLVRSALSVHLGISESLIRVVAPELGGGFGIKSQIYPEEFIATALALKFRRPIKWVQDRREDLLTSVHARDHRYEAAIAATKDGIITALRVKMYSNAGAYSSFPFGCAMEVIGPRRYVPGPYKIQNSFFRTFGVCTNTAPTGAFRGVGAPGTYLVLEGLIDRLARRLDLDPLEVRLRNTIRPEEIPYTHAHGGQIDSGSYLPALVRAREMIGYDRFRALQPADRLVNGRFLGIGICQFSEGSGFSTAAWRARGLVAVPGIASALIRIDQDGQILAHVSHTSSGQGHGTIFAQLVAERLGANYDDVTIVQSDTASVPYGSGTFASRGTITGGGAIIRAARELQEKLRRFAGFVMNVDASSIVLEGSRARRSDTPDVSVSFAELGKVAYSFDPMGFPQGEQPGLEATAYYEPPMATIGNAIHIAIVSVGPEDGSTRIEKYVVVHDNGTTINPLLVDGQVQGATAQGIGGALMEEVVYDGEGQLLSGNLLDYLVPTALDIPGFDLAHMESPSPSTEGGFKGMGEGGVIGGLAAITNAVADALAGTGANVNCVPLRPSRIVEMMKAAGSRAARA